MLTQPPSRGIPRPPASSRTGPLPSGPLPAGAGGAWQGYLDIQFRDGPVRRRVLSGNRLLIGRTNQASLTLDHDTVSRQHAELFCDPFGRWWVRDLDSTNGTSVNDEPITERVLRPSDWIRIGDYVLYFHVTPALSVEIPEGPPSDVEVDGDDEDDEATSIGTIHEFEAPHLSSKHLFLLMDMSRKLISMPTSEERFGSLCDLLVGEAFHGLSAVVLRYGVDDTLTTLAGPRFDGEGSRRAHSHVSNGVLRKLRATGEPVLASNLAGQSSVGLTISAKVLPLSVVACVLRRNDAAIDLLYVTLPPPLGTVEWLALIALASEVCQQAEFAWEARHHAENHAAIERELSMARDIQQSLVPDDQRFGDLEVAIGFDPCRWVAGDYVDAVVMPDGKLLLAVADVCGKGLEAAMVASSLHTLVRSTVSDGRSFEDLIVRLNEHLCTYLPQHSFVTMVLTHVDPDTGELLCFNAGHPPAIVVDREGATRELQSAVHPAFGILPGMQPELCRDTLAAGEVLLIYTDGLTELRDSSRQMLGLEALHVGFARMCPGALDGSVSDLAGRLTNMLDKFRGGQGAEDDRAFVVARRRG